MKKLETTAPGVAHRQLKVLLIDRNTDSLELMFMLSEHYGHQTRGATGCVDARRVAQEWAADIILTGMRLIDCTGEELAHEFKKDPSTSSIPLVALTGRPVCMSPEIFLEFDYVVQKPFPADFFGSLLSKCLADNC